MSSLSSLFIPCIIPFKMSFFLLSCVHSLLLPYITPSAAKTLLCIIVLAGSSSDCVVTAVMSGVLFFIVGLVSGLAGGVLVVYCCVKWQSKHHSPPSQSAPLYEDIVTSTVKDEVELQIRANMSYGQVR